MNTKFSRAVSCSVAAFVAVSGLVAPTAAYAQKPPPTSTPVPKSKWVTQEIKFGKLKAYEHESGWFSMKYPSNWTIDDKSTENNVVLTFTDPTSNGAVFVNVFPESEELAKEDMADKLDEFNATSFKKLTKYKSSAATAMKNLNGASQVFSYETKVDKKTVKMYGDSFYEQYDNTLVSIIVMLLPEEQYVTVKPKGYEIIDSFTAKPENYTAKDNAPVSGDVFSIGDLTDYEHSTGAFKLKVPDGWDELDNSSKEFIQAVWTDDTKKGLVSASAAKTTKTYKTADLKKEAESFIKSFTGNKGYSDTVIGTTKSETGAVITSFTYTYAFSDGDQTMLGFVMVKQDGKTLGFLSVSVPTTADDDATSKMGDMFDSFEVDGTAKF